MIAQTLGHYRVLEKIGSGGMGEVYRAHDERLERDVALKVLPAGLLADESARRRFRKEALALAKLNHPNIGVIYDFDSQDGIDFLVMEHIPGVTLSEKLGAGSLAEKETLRLGLQLADGLAAAHEQGVAHCDLKPANLRVTPDGRLKILDFGLARLVRPGGETVTETLTQAGMAGTLPYMAPEQLRGEPADTRTDIWAAGAVLYETATGQRAFPEGEPARLMDAILHLRPAAPRGLNPQLQSIILKALDKEPSLRYQTARELRVDLERLATPASASRAVLPPRPALWNRLWQRTRAHPRAAGLSVLSILLAVIVILWIAGSRPVLSFAPRDWILVTEFDNQTGDALFDRSLLTALTVGLEQSAHANVFPRARIATTLKRMGKTGGERLDEELGREICVRENIRGLLSPAIARVGQQYALSARLIDPQTGAAVRSYLEQARDQNHILEALGAVATRLRRDLGESLAATRKADRPLAQVTTPSLQALKLYTEGGFLWAKGQYNPAAELQEAAVKADPDFAMAHAALGIYYYSHLFNNPVAGKEHFEKALQLSARTTERERLLIQVEYASNLGHFDEAVRLYSVYLGTYPDHWGARYNFGNLLRDHGRPEEAIEQYNEVLRLAPNDAAAYINLSTCYSALGNVKEALRQYEQAFKLEPTWVTSANLNHEYGFTLVRSGDEAKAREVFALAVAKPDLKAKGLRSLALLDLYHGKYRDAKARFQEALLLNKTRKWSLSEAREHGFLSIVAEGQGDRAGRLRELDQEAALLPNLGEKLWMGAFVGVAYARLGAVAKGRQVLQAVKPEADPLNPRQISEFHRFEGELDLARGNPARAAELLQQAEREKSGPMTVASLAHFYEATGDIGQAIAWYEKLIGMHDLALGWEPQQTWVAAHYHLAKLYVSRGDKAKAVSLLDALLELWKEADDDLPLLRDARRLRQQLQAKP